MNTKKENTKVVNTEGSKNETDKEIKAFGDSADLKRKVTRKEVVEIMQQIIDNINQTNEYLMQDVNTMYGQQVFPFQMNMYALQKVLIDKGYVTQEEIDEVDKEHRKEILQRAREVKENDKGGLDVVSKEEEEKDEKEKVVQFVNKKKTEE